jgi:hypothetical protein
MKGTIKLKILTKQEALKRNSGLMATGINDHLYYNETDECGIVCIVDI